MAIEVKLPGLGEGIESGDVLELLVKEGDTVKAEQGLIEFETDKATVTLPSPVAGKVIKILVAQGDSVPVGQVVAQLEATSGSTAPTTNAPPAAPAKPPVQEVAVVPQAAPVSLPAPVQQTPPVQPLPVAAQPPVSPQQHASTAARHTAPQHAGQQPPFTPASITDSAQTGQLDSVAAGPAVRRFAREVGVDLSMVTGTGPGGRITRDDVLRSVRESSSAARASSAPPTSTAIAATSNNQSVAVPMPSSLGGNKAISLPGEASHDDYGPVRIERLSKIRKTIAAQMHKSSSTVPRVTNFDDADVTDLEAFRQQSKDDYAAEGIKLTTMPFLMKAVATALRHHPSLNAVIDMENDQITYRDYVNLGVAVDTDRGLVVPNIRHADSLSIPGIAKALADLAARVRKGDFGVNELRGGTFTISNLGAIGGTYSTPIVNVPEVAILLVGRTRKLPVVMDDDSIQPRLMMPLSLSYDHRLVDGGAAARFLNDVIAYLEAPSRLLLAIS